MLCCDVMCCPATPEWLKVDAVPAGRLLWQLTWDQMLCVELAYHSQQHNAAPDGVIVHRKYRSEADDVLVHDVRCNPNNNQVRLAWCGRAGHGRSTGVRVP